MEGRRQKAEGDPLTLMMSCERYMSMRIMAAAALRALGLEGPIPVTVLSRFRTISHLAANGRQVVMSFCHRAVNLLVHTHTHTHTHACIHTQS